MRTDFEISAEVEHNGSKGTVREHYLRDFLAKGRLPEKYGLGSGEIIGRTRGSTSRQCDLIVYDKLNGVTLLYDPNVQVFPVDCVYGIVEVKSQLSKDEFRDSLKKISAFKAMAPSGHVTQPLGGGFNMIHPRPRPFGAIFAYSLCGNSLDSLIANLREWETETPPALWPNYICVLEAGIIYHHGNPFEVCLDSASITNRCWPIAIHHGEDSLFKFYCAIHDMCARMSLGPVELSHYSDPALQIGKYVVHGRGSDGEIRNDGNEPKRVQLTEATITRIVTWCAEHPRVTYRETLIQRFGSLPLGMEQLKHIDSEVYLYNPDNLPGFHELGPDAVKQTPHGPSMSPCLATAFELVIDGSLYVVASAGFTNADYEESP